jgi:hypothetical protein
MASMAQYFSWSEQGLRLLFLELTQNIFAIYTEVD